MASSGVVRTMTNLDPSSFLGRPSGAMWYDDKEFKQAVDALFSVRVPCSFYVPNRETRRFGDIVIVLEDHYFPFTGNQPSSTLDCINFRWQLAVLGLHPVLNMELTTDQTDDRRTISIVLCPTEMRYSKPHEAIVKYLQGCSLMKGEDGKLHPRKVAVALVGRHAFSFFESQAKSFSSSPSSSSSSQPPSPLDIAHELTENPELMRHYCIGQIDLSVLTLAEIQRELIYYYYNDDPDSNPSFQYVRKICPFCTKRIPTT